MAQSGGVLQPYVWFGFQLESCFPCQFNDCPNLLSASSMSWLLATFSALVGAVPAPNFGVSVWQSHAPEPNELVVAVDLDLCSNKATFTNNRCPSATGQPLDHEIS